MQLMHMLREIIHVIPKEEYQAYVREAQSISPDEKDILYLALAIKLQCPVWSNDKKLKEQHRVIVYSTPELIKKLRK